MNRLPYVAPTIQRLGAGPVNPFRLGASPCCAGIDGVSIASLTREHGSPLFVFSEKTLRDKYREAHRAFSRRYPDVQFAWSYKTNYLNAICNLFHQEGSIAEVVSGFEYEKARGNGIPGNRIIFNGPYKERADLERAIAEGAMIQVDNIDELLTLASMTKGRKEPLPVALRINVITGTQPVWSKFGFSADNGEAIQVIQRMRSMPQLTLQGLHCHVGTFILDPEAYRVAATCLVALAGEVETAGVGNIRYLNLGGGFASHARLHYQYLPPEQVTPSMDRYAAAICDTITQLWPKGRDLPRLYLETGRALVDDAGYLISTVVAIKSRPLDDGLQVALVAYGKGAPASAGPGLNTALAAYGKGAPASAGAASSRNAIVLDAGVNLLYTSTWYQINILPVRPCSDSPQPTTVYGCLCMNIDVIREETPLPSLTTGDQVVLHPVGAYNVTQAMQFITYRPAVVLIGVDGRVHVIRKRENLGYVQELENVPDYLSSNQTTPAIRA